MADNDDNELARKTVASGAGAITTGAITLAAGAVTAPATAALVAVATATVSAFLVFLEEAHRTSAKKRAAAWFAAFTRNDAADHDEAVRELEERMQRDPNTSRAVLDGVKAALEAVDDAAIPVLALLARDRVERPAESARFFRAATQLVAGSSLRELRALQQLLRDVTTLGTEENGMVVVGSNATILGFVGRGATSPVVGWSASATIASAGYLMAAMESSNLVQPTRKVGTMFRMDFELHTQAGIPVAWATRLLAALDAGLASSEFVAG